MLGTFHISFNKNKHVKHVKTQQDTHARLKGELSNLLDVLERLISNWIKIKDS